MLARNKFVRLDIKQKIYKIAYAIREQEELLESGGQADFFVVDSYLEYIQADKNIKRVARVLEAIQKYLPRAQSDIALKQRVQALNFCFHEILEILDEPVGEKFYRVRVFDSVEAERKFETGAILENLRSAFNVGNIFRSADGFGLGSLCLAGISPRPPSLKIERTAMGTVESVDWSYHQRAVDAIKDYREKGYRVYAVETVEGAVPLSSIRSFEKTAFIFGNEEFGISDEALAAADQAVRIPLVGKKNSMNVANVFAVVMYRAMESLLGS